MTGAWSLRYRAPDRTAGQFAEYDTLTLVERYNLPGTLQLTGRSTELASLLVAASGCTLADDTGSRRFNGPLTSATVNGDGTCVLNYTDDLGALWQRYCYPDPAHAITGQLTDTDARTGAAETVALAYISANAGPGALAARRVAGLALPTSGGRGGTIKKTARLDVLGTLIAAIGEAANLRFTVVQVGTALNLTVTAVPDLSATAKYGDWNSGGPGLVSSDWSYTFSQPTVTDATAAGGGDGQDRVFREVVSSSAESTWGVKIEQLVDETQTFDTDELTAAAQAAVDAGTVPTTVSATVLDSPDLRIGVDVPLGALVTLNLGGQTVVDRLRVITTTIANQSGSPTISVVPTIGDPDAGLSLTSKRLAAVTAIARKAASH